MRVRSVRAWPWRLSGEAVEPANPVAACQTTGEPGRPRSASAVLPSAARRQRRPRRRVTASGAGACGDCARERAAALAAGATGGRPWRARWGAPERDPTPWSWGADGSRGVSIKGCREALPRRRTQTCRADVAAIARRGRPARRRSVSQRSAPERHTTAAIAAAGRRRLCGDGARHRAAAHCREGHSEQAQAVTAAFSGAACRAGRRRPCRQAAASASGWLFAKLLKIDIS